MEQPRPTIQLPEPYVMHRGGVLPEVHIAYETWGKLNAARDNVILIFTGMSPDAHAASSPMCPRAGWWEYMIGPGKALDTERFHIICVNSLGSCFGSTGPGSINPCSGQPYGPDFPMLSIEDVACTAKLALQQMGIERVHAIVGPSMGGMTALAYALIYPDRVDNLVVISSAAQASAFAIAIRSLQREAVRSDPNWKGGWYYGETYPMAGMRLARKIGVLSYRSIAEFNERFGRNKIDELRRMTMPVELEFEVESYLEHQANKFSGSFDPNSYLVLSHSMDLFDVADYGKDLMDGFTPIQAQRALVIGVSTDILFPEYQQQEIADGLRQAGCEVTYHKSECLEGHDAFLVARSGFDEVIADFFA